MKRSLSVVLLVLFVALVGGTFWFLWSKSQAAPVVFTTEKAEVRDVVKKTVATGAVVPRLEVEIKPRVSGVLEHVFVQPGALVKSGDPIARVRVVPDAQSLNRAEGEVRAKKIALDDARRELARNQGLFDRGVLPEIELARAKTAAALAEQATRAAGSELQIVREGQARGGKDTSNVVVTSTVDGMVIDVPVKAGSSVIESNTFNAGTTVATVADMTDLIFLGNLDESEVGKVKEGMTLQIKIGALDDKLQGTLEYIAPKGKVVDGAVQFEIRAALIRRPEVFVRAGYSANADIVLDERKGVLALREALVQFDPDKKAFVEVETTPQVFVRKDVELGLSDGIYVELKGGVDAQAAVKLPGTAGPPQPPSKG